MNNNPLQYMEMWKHMLFYQLAMNITKKHCLLSIIIPIADIFDMNYGGKAENVNQYKKKTWNHPF